jgi:hypothetical protein
VTPTSITAKIMAAVGLITAFIMVLHPGFHPPTWTQWAAASLGLIIAGAVQMYDLIVHHHVSLQVRLGTVQPPAWLNATWLNQFIGLLVTTIVGLVALVHPGFTEPSNVRAIVTSVSGMIVILIPLIDRYFTMLTNHVTKRAYTPLS